MSESQIKGSHSFVLATGWKAFQKQIVDLFVLITESVETYLLQK